MPEMRRYGRQNRRSLRGIKAKNNATKTVDRVQHETPDEPHWGAVCCSRIRTYGASINPSAEPTALAPRVILVPVDKRG